MHYSLVQTVAPTSEPISLDEAKAQLRVNNSNFDDTLISSIIASARAFVETFTGRQIMPATFRMKTDGFPTAISQYWRFYDICLGAIASASDPQVIYLPRSPATSVSSIAYIDTAGNSQTLSASDYIVDTDSAVPRIVPAVDTEWPDTQDRISTVTITFIAGYATVPPEMLAAMRFLIADLYEMRSINVPSQLAENPLYKRLLYAQRIWDCP